MFFDKIFKILNFEKMGWGSGKILVGQKSASTALSWRVRLVHSLRAPEFVALAAYGFSRRLEQ